jgi:hypothetical protein
MSIQNNSTDSMIISAISLAMRLLFEGLDFYPILHYFDEEEVITSTISEKLRFEKLEELIQEISKDNGFNDFVFIFNVPEENRFYIRIIMGGITYAYRVIDYTYCDEKINFSEMYANEED